METTVRKSMHPLIAIAAIAVTLFSLVGIAAITGLIPTSHSQTEQMQPAVKPADSPVAAVTPAASVEPPAAAVKPAEKHVARKAAAKPVHTIAAAETPAPVTIAQNAPIPAPAATFPPPPATMPPPPPPPAETVKPICLDCGVIESVHEIERKGAGTGVGAVAGGLLGGVLGRQTGSGHGRDAMTVLGAIGGAVAGNEIEKNTKKLRNYQIMIRFDDGPSRLITQDNPPAWRSGDRIRLVNGVISADNS